MSHGRLIIHQYRRLAPVLRFPFYESDVEIAAGVLLGGGDYGKRLFISAVPAVCITVG